MTVKGQLRESWSFLLNFIRITGPTPFLFKVVSTARFFCNITNKLNWVVKQYKILQCLHFSKDTSHWRMLLSFFSPHSEQSHPAWSAISISVITTSSVSLRHHCNILKLSEIEYGNWAKTFSGIFSSKMSWNSHIDYIAPKAYRMLGFLRRNFRPVPFSVKEIL